MEIEYASQPLSSSYNETHETKQALNELMSMFEQFKEANNERIKQLENHHADDTITRDKVDRINRSMDYMMDELRRPAKEFSVEDTHNNCEYRAAFNDYMRGGNTQQLKQLEIRALSAGVNSEGGYSVPSSIDQEIAMKLADTSPLRKMAMVQQISVGNVYKKLNANTNLSTSWVGEVASRTETNTPVFQELNVSLHEQYANPAASAILLEDSAIDIDAWLVEALQSAFAEAEATSFISGNGTNQPKGILTYTTKLGNTAEWNRLLIKKSGSASAIPSSDYGAFLIDLIYNLPTVYRHNAHWLLNRQTQAELRKLRDEAGNYLWLPPSSSDQSSMFLGHPVMEDSNMPDIAANNLPILFGDFKAAYVIVDKFGTQILRDPYSNKPYVLFYTTRRVGGAMQNFDALRALKIAA